jgi:predicted DCC family thiol-disulfide oxidoreductase YuxK
LEALSEKQISFLKRRVHRARYLFENLAHHSDMALLQHHHTTNKANINMILYAFNIPI